MLALLLVALAAFIALWGGGWLDTESRRTEVAPPPAKPAPVEPTRTAVPVQPDLEGYEYLLTEEHAYAVDVDGRIEPLERRRESWRAADGWMWARQTGGEPARFIFASYPAWKYVRQAEPQADELEKAIVALVDPDGSSSEQERIAAGFDFVEELLGLAPLPEGALPLDYRQALVDMLGQQDGIVVSRQARDPVGREATRITLTSTDVVRSFWVDADYLYLAYEDTVEGQDPARLVVVDRRRVADIPDDLLTELGTERVSKVIWD